MSTFRRTDHKRPNGVQFGREMNSSNSNPSSIGSLFAELSVDDTILSKPPTHEYLNLYHSKGQAVEQLYFKWTQRNLREALIKNGLICPFISSIINRIRSCPDEHFLPAQNEALLSLCDLITLLKAKSGTYALQNAIIHLLRFLTVHSQENRLRTDEYEMIAKIHDVYVRTLDLTDVPSQILTILCINLKILIAKCEEKVIQVLNYIIVENQEVLGYKLLDLIFLRDEQFTSLTIINSTINAAIEKYPEHLDPIDRMVRFAKLSAEIEENRLKFFYLGLVRNLIIENVDQIYSNGRVQNWVSSVLGYLLLSVKSSDDMTKLAIARCLGEFGAIDFGRFASTPGSDSKDLGEIFHWDTDSEKFKTSLLTRIGSKNVSQGEALNFEVVNFTLKQVLTAFRSKPKDRVILELPEAVKNLCLCLIDTNMNRKIEAIAPPAPTSFPIFTPQKLYDLWLLQWTGIMIDDLDCSKLPGSLFKSLFSLFVTDIPFLEDMLPCIVLNYLTNRLVDQDRKMQVVVNEVSAIVSSALPNGKTFATFEYSSAVSNQVSITSVVLTETQHMCAQRVFVLFDYFTKWLNELQIAQEAKKSYFTTLFGNADKCSMAYLAYGCRAYPRSLRYLEEYLRNSDCKLSSLCARLFQQIYIALGEPDGVNGVKSIGNYDPDLMDRILLHEANNRFQDALTCCEQSVKMFPEKLDAHEKMIRCLMSLEQTAIAYNYASGLTVQAPSWKDKVTPYMATCAWQLGKWQDLDTIVRTSEKDVEKSSMSLNLSKLLNCILTKDSETFRRLLVDVSIKAMHPITAAVSESSPYERCYPHLVQLQKLNEITAASSILFEFQPDPSYADCDGNWLRRRWLERNRYVQPNMKALEPILSLQRAIFSLGGQGSKEYDMDIADSWLVSAKLARKSGCFQRAYSCLLKADSLILGQEVKKDLPFVASFFIEFAKYHWSCGDRVSKEAAIKCLETALNKHFVNFEDSSRVCSGMSSAKSSRVVSQKDQKAHTKILLLRAKYYEESSYHNTQDIIKMYNNLMSEKSTEKVAFQLAKLYEKIFESHESRTECVEHMVQAIINYKTTLHLGTKYVYEALPRLLKLWFWLGTLNYAYETAKTNRGTNASRASEALKSGGDIKGCFDKATTFVEKLRSDVPSYVLFTAMSQMLSRVNHPHQKVQETLHRLLVNILVKHHLQASWLMFSVQVKSNKNDNSLSAACDKIIKSASKTSKEVAAFLQLMQTAQKHFNDLINLPHEKNVTKLSLKDSRSQLCAFLRQQSHKILVPSSKFLRSTMPSHPNSSSNYNAFSDIVTIIGVRDEITIFNSLAYPKKFILLGSDGNEYPFLAKPKDDLRRDARVMEYLELMNRLLLKDPETRKRGLQIKIYTVIPFGPESGLIQFVEGLRDIKSIILGEYANVRRPLNTNEIKRLHTKYDRKDLSLQARCLHDYQKYVSELCKPPVLWQWFARFYPNPTVWHMAKLNFTRSLALMSIVGYIIGLGDRHLENMVLECATGKVVHVDFNCIFNGGEKLNVPERVPFRLTHNLVDAMGITGLQGHFRRTCEEVMRVARNNLDPIMSNLEPFVYDPLVGAAVEPKNTQIVTPKNPRRSKGEPESSIFKKMDEILSDPKVKIRGVVEMVEYLDSSSVKSISLIEERLKGQYRKITSTDCDPRPFSVSGQVNALIEDATDDNNLCRMFVGWAPYL